MVDAKTISVIIPIYNEAGNIGRLVRETLAATPAAVLGEIIVVDDCSNDDGPEEVLEIARENNPVRLIRHLENAGQSAALRTGILAARFPVIATLDGDGQNDPHDIEKLHAALGEPGADSAPALIGGIREKRRDTGSKRLASKAANAIRTAVLRDGCPDTGCGLKLFWREAFLQLPFFTSLHRYLPALFQTYGYRTEFLPVNARERQAGVSKYNNLGRALIGFYDLFGVSWLRRRTRTPPVREEN